MEKRAKQAIMILSVVVIALVLVVVYAFAVRPALNGYAVKSYNQGYVQGISDVAKAVSQSGYVQIPLSNNQSMVLVQYQQPKASTSNASTNSS